LPYVWFLTVSNVARRTSVNKSGNPLKVAVFGATGAQGAPVVRQALASGMTVRAVARDAKKITKMHPGAEAMAADIADTEAVAKALAGMDGAFYHLPMGGGPDSPRQWLGAFIQAAAGAKLPLVVYTTSGPASDIFPASMVVDGIRAGAAVMLEGPVPAIVLQPALYLENLLGPVILPRLRTEGIADYPPFRPAQKVTWTSHLDQAKIAVAALSRPDLAGNRYDIGSPGALDGTELAELLGSWLDRPVRFAPLTPAGFGQRMAEVYGIPEVGAALTDLYDVQANLPDAGAPVETRHLEEIFGVSLTPAATHIKSWPAD
jgi:uncharacterized protein YbjT (DUF2867 family)